MKTIFILLSSLIFVPKIFAVDAGVISGPEAGDLTSTTAVISWKTNIRTTSVKNAADNQNLGLSLPGPYNYTTP